MIVFAEVSQRRFVLVAAVSSPIDHAPLTLAASSSLIFTVCALAGSPDRLGHLGV